MTKSELKPGYVVRYRDGNLRMVMPLENELILVEMVFEDPCYSTLTYHNEDLTCRHCPSCDIMEVYGFSNSRWYVWTFEENDRELLWQRNKKKKYTYAQLREILGEEFEVVG